MRAYIFSGVAVLVSSTLAYWAGAHSAAPQRRAAAALCTGLTSALGASVATVPSDAEDAEPELSVPEPPARDDKTWPHRSRPVDKRAGDRIIIMPAGNIHENNVEKIARETAARELHVTGFRGVDSGMQFRNPRVFMGGLLRPPEYTRSVTDAGVIGKLVRLAGGQDD